MSKDLFLQMREQEIATLYDATFTKKDAILTGKKMIDNLIENGDVDRMQFMTSLCRLKEVVNSADAELRKHIELNSSYKLNGVEFTPVQGGETLNYKDDEVYSQMYEDLKQREELLKLAYKSKDEIYDSEGVQVPKVSASARKSSITIKF